MGSVVRTVVKLIFNTVVLIASIGFFALVYILIFIGELRINKPKLVIH